MIAWTALVALAAFTVGVVCLVLVLHDDYEDGLVGRVALAAMCMASFARFGEIVETAGRVYISPVGALMWIGLALFMARHFYRFLRWRRAGAYDWRATKRAEAPGKRA